MLLLACKHQLVTADSCRVSQTVRDPNRLLACCLLRPVDCCSLCSERVLKTSMIALKRASAARMLMIAAGSYVAAQGAAFLLRGPCQSVSACISDAPCALCWAWPVKVVCQANSHRRVVFDSAPVVTACPNFRKPSRRRAATSECVKYASRLSRSHVMTVLFAPIETNTAAERSLRCWLSAITRKIGGLISHILTGSSLGCKPCARHGLIGRLTAVTAKQHVAYAGRCWHWA